MNRGWIDRSAGRVPTYKEVTAGAGSSKSALLDDDDDDADGGFNAPNDEAQVDDTNGLDDEFEDVVDHFESSYNFRFEEPCVPFFCHAADLAI
jgi:protein KRI1